MTPKTYPQFLLLGDSIIQYSSFLKDGFSFGAGIAEHCQRRLDVINKGLSGYNTANTLVILEDLIPSPSHVKVDYLLLLLGANDACLPESPSGQHVPLENYRKNLRTIITHPSVTIHQPIILLVTPPPIHEVHLEAEDLKKNYGGLTRTQGVTAQYAQVVREVAAEFKDESVLLVDLHKALLDEASRTTPDYVPGSGLIGTKETGDSEGFRGLLVDGLHFTGAGYKVFLDAVLPNVGKQWAEEPLNNPSWVFPHWTIAPRIDK